MILASPLVDCNLQKYVPIGSLNFSPLGRPFYLMALANENMPKGAMRRDTQTISQIWIP